MTEIVGQFTADKLRVDLDGDNYDDLTGDIYKDLGTFILPESDGEEEL